jgi:hypothetical protein
MQEDESLENTVPYEAEFDNTIPYEAELDNTVPYEAVSNIEQKNPPPVIKKSILKVNPPKIPTEKKLSKEEEERRLVLKKIRDEEERERAEYRQANESKNRLRAKVLSKAYRSTLKIMEESKDPVVSKGFKWPDELIVFDNKDPADLLGESMIPVCASLAILHSQCPALRMNLHSFWIRFSPDGFIIPWAPEVLPELESYIRGLNSNAEKEYPSRKHDPPAKIDTQALLKDISSFAVAMFYGRLSDFEMTSRLDMLDHFEKHPLQLVDSANHYPYSFYERVKEEDELNAQYYLKRGSGINPFPTDANIKKTKTTQAVLQIFTTIVPSYSIFAPGTVVQDFAHLSTKERVDNLKHNLHLWNIMGDLAKGIFFGTHNTGGGNVLQCGKIAVFLQPEKVSFDESVRKTCCIDTRVVEEILRSMSDHKKLYLKVRSDSVEVIYQWVQERRVGKSANAPPPSAICEFDFTQGFISATPVITGNIIVVNEVQLPQPFKVFMNCHFCNPFTKQSFYVNSLEYQTKMISDFVFNSQTVTKRQFGVTESSIIHPLLKKAIVKEKFYQMQIQVNRIHLTKINPNLESKEAFEDLDGALHPIFPFSSCAYEKPPTKEELQIVHTLSCPIYKPRAAAGADWKIENLNRQFVEELGGINSSLLLFSKNYQHPLFKKRTPVVRISAAKAMLHAHDLITEPDTDLTLLATAIRESTILYVGVTKQKGIVFIREHHAEAKMNQPDESTLDCIIKYDFTSGFSTAVVNTYNKYDCPVEKTGREVLGHVVHTFNGIQAPDNFPVFMSIGLIDEPSDKEYPVMYFRKVSRLYNVKPYISPY